jgi:hypothetical protein
MRKKNTLQGLLFAGTLLFAVAAKGQGVAADSASQKPYDKKVISLQAKIGEDSAKLVKYKGMISQFEQDKKNAADKAQQSADDNKTAANRLSDDPQSKKLAKKASSAASDAKSDAKKARVAAEKLDDLNKDIEKLTKQLEKEHGKLEKLQNAAQPAAAANR